MAINSSSSNDSLLPPHPPFMNFGPLTEFHCYTSRPNSFIFISFYIISIFLLLPPSIFILYHGLQRLRSSSSASLSHSDCFTYHMVAIELINVLMSVLYLCAIIKKDLNIFIANDYLSAFRWHGQTFFHLLMCVERYLAVVHPITYRSLRNDRGIRIRNICIGCVWLLSLVGMSTRVIQNVLIIVDFCILMFTLAVVSFCSLSVLRVLIHPGPQEQGRERVDRFRRRAFYTIVAILAVLLLTFVWGLVWAVLNLSGNISVCLLTTCDPWINLPSSLVVPLLFVHKEGKLMCCRTNNQVG